MIHTYVIYHPSNACLFLVHICVLCMACVFLTSFVCMQSETIFTDSCPLSSDMAGVSVCPPVAMDQGMELLCQLFEQWGQVPSGFLIVMQWLLGDGEGNDKTVPDKDSSLVSFCYITWSQSGTAKLQELFF